MAHLFVRTLVVVGLVLAVLSRSARAQPSGPAAPPDSPGPATPAPAPADDDGAGPLVEQAAREYDDSHLDQAIQTLARAYALSPRPSILYNMAQVLRAKGDCAGALDAYQRFAAAAAPDDPNRKRALGRQLEMQVCLEQTQPRMVAAATPQSPPSEPTAAGASRTRAREPSEPTRPPLALAPAGGPPPAGVTNAGVSKPRDKEQVPPRRIARNVGWALVGIGGAAAVTAAIFAWRAASLSSDVTSALNKTPAWTDSLSSKEEEGTRDACWARWIGAGALAAGAGGAVLLIVLRAPSPSGDATHPSPAGVTGALVGFSGAF